MFSRCLLLVMVLVCGSIFFCQCQLQPSFMPFTTKTDCRMHLTLFRVAEASVELFSMRLSAALC
jgi:hypothetical protein